jgi:hypothetical protein
MQALPKYTAALTAPESQWNESILQQCTAALHHIQGTQQRLTPVLTLIESWEKLIREREEYALAVAIPINYSGQFSNAYTSSCMHSNAVFMLARRQLMTLVFSALCSVSNAMHFRMRSVLSAATLSAAQVYNCSLQL